MRDRSILGEATYRLPDALRTSGVLVPLIHRPRRFGAGTRGTLMGGGRHES